MKTLKTLMTENMTRLNTKKEILDAIKKYQKDGEVVNPEYENLVYSARQVFKKDTQAGKEILLTHVQNNQETVSDLARDMYYDYPDDSFVRLNKIKKMSDKFAKEKYFDKVFQKKIIKATNDLAKEWQPIHADIKAMKSTVIKMTQVRARLKQAKEKEFSQKKADAKVLVKELETVRKEYVDVATKRTKEFVKDRMAVLKKNGMDLDKLLPKNTRTGEGKQLRILYNMITKSDGSKYSMRDPDIRKRDQAGINRYVKMAVQQAEGNFDAFVAKMVEKVGPVSKAKLTGTIWTNALLTVITDTGETEKWATKIILNFSKYGKMFNQFPTRKKK